ncbi:glycoside hydrolase family 5 protein [Plenodomus tracheiphilus IPT5]|uniref:Glycoside hydrolase family 5 protein n=1 Tax=Plenodomus tracheiphilus IPT5 TaxID=1408161 RepID=A0A6A7AXY9_9PLEO|nr:glycoside hydrolase family 5 protein [Plenodomus tracheiphilus IPT5]
MFVSVIVASLLSLSLHTKPAFADLRITADHHSFGGVNYPSLQFFTPQHRDDTIREIVKSGARVIRLFRIDFSTVRPDKQHDDPEGELGGFDKSLLDQFDDTMAAVHHLSKGQIKVIIVPHDAHALRGTNDVPCDAYCKKLDGAFLDFYSSDEVREVYKTRLEVFFKHYPSKNFDKRPWAELSEVILGVDLQNQPFSGIWPIPSGESWLCDIANHLKFHVGLDQSNIAVISGGVSGPQSADGVQNFPDSVFDCAAIDVIGIHGYFSKENTATAGTSWAKLFVPGNTLTARAQKKDGKGKLLLVEEWAYVDSKFGSFYKKEAIFDQGNALNVRGIPWLYSHLTTLNEGRTARVNPLRTEYTAWTALKDVLKRAYTTRSNFDWAKYLPPPSVGPPKQQTSGGEWTLKRAGLSNMTTIPLNPYVVQQSDCTFGCEGHLCDAADGCRPDLLCKNNTCQQNQESQPGQIGSKCNSKQVCQAHLPCSHGECQKCSVRRTIQPEETPGENSTLGESPPQNPNWHRVVANDPNGSCQTDDLPNLFELWQQDGSQAMLPICRASTGRGNPCESAEHCDAESHCSWGLCTRCLSTDSCLGAVCRSNAKCKTGFCNEHGRCDYAGQKKIIAGPGGARMSKNKRIAGVPKGHERGPAKVRNEAMRINIPKDQVRETGLPRATA